MSTASLMPPARRPSVRLLVMGWALWLLAVWVVMWSQHSVGPKAVRLLLFAAAVGMLGVWPAVRLSQLGSVAGVLLDWAALNVLWQAVVWPMASIMRWPLDQTVWLGVAMAGWSLWIGWLIAVGGLSHRGGVRAATMAACALLLVGEPAVMALGGGEWRPWISPIGALGALTQRPGYFQPQLWHGRLTMTAAAGAGAWGVLIAVLALRPRAGALR